MTKNMIARSASALALIASLSLGACASGGNLTDKINPKTEASQQPTSTSDYVADIHVGLDENGNIRARRPLSYTESIMLANIDKHCLEVTNTLEPSIRPMFKNGVLLGSLLGLGTAIGSLAFPGADFISYLMYGGASGVASGIGTGKITYDQIRGVVHGYCVLQWVEKNEHLHGDTRLRELIIIPAPGLRGKRPTAAPFGDDDRQMHDSRMKPGANTPTSDSSNSTKPVITG